MASMIEANRGAVDFILSKMDRSLPFSEFMDIANAVRSGFLLVLTDDAIANIDGDTVRSLVGAMAQHKLIYRGRDGLIHRGPPSAEVTSEVSE